MFQAPALPRSPILLHSPSLLHPASSLLHPAPSFLIDHCDYTLHLFGGGALSSLLSAPPGTPPVREMHCHCMEPAELARWLPSAATSCPQLNVSLCNSSAHTHPACQPRPYTQASHPRPLTQPARPHTQSRPLTHPASQPAFRGRSVGRQQLLCPTLCSISHRSEFTAPPSPPEPGTGAHWSGFPGAAARSCRPGLRAAQPHCL